MPQPIFLYEALDCKLDKNAVWKLERKKGLKHPNIISALLAPTKTFPHTLHVVGNVVANVTWVRGGGVIVNCELSSSSDKLACDKCNVGSVRLMRRVNDTHMRDVKETYSWYRIVNHEVN